MKSNDNKLRLGARRATRRRALGVASLIGIAAALPWRAWGQSTAPKSQAGATSSRRAVILVVGDSLSAEYGIARGRGWVALLEQRLARVGRRYQIVNASISGETTSGGRARIADLLARHRPSVVVVELGGNDALRGLDLGSSEGNLREILRRSREAGAKSLLLGMMVPPNYGRAYADRFSAMFARVAQAERAALLPFFLEGVADRPELFQSDRIHPNEQAQPILLENVWPQLEPLL